MNLIEFLNKRVHQYPYTSHDISNFYSKVNNSKYLYKPNNDLPVISNFNMCLSIY